MAKAKKPTEETTPAAPEKKAAPKKKAADTAVTASAETTAPKAAAKAPAAKKAANKPAPTGTGGFSFGIDTNLAAQNAARMLLNRSSISSNSTGGGAARHIKDSLAKSQSAPNLGNLLGGGTTTGGKSANTPHFSNQKGHNQATGHVGNTGVPRRTPG